MPWYGYALIAMLLLAMFLATSVEKTMPWKTGAIVATFGTAAIVVLCNAYRNPNLIQLSLALLAVVWFVMGRHINNRVHHNENDAA